MDAGDQFLLASPTFSPPLFLSQLHSNESTQALLHGLDFLSRSIDQKTAALKQLVESNFERFIKAKAVIDAVYDEMRCHGTEPTGDLPLTHSRHASKSSNHFRNTSGSGSGAYSGVGGGRKPSSGGKQRLTLVEETEYGLLAIKTPMAEVSARAQELWGPAMGGIEREDRLRALLGIVGKYRAIFEAPVAVANCIKQRDYRALTDEYARARRYASEAKSMVESTMESGAAVTDPQIYQVLATTQMWVDVEKQTDDFKRDIWRRLVGTQVASPASAPSVALGHADDHLELISVLLELGVQDNPIWVWLLSRYDNLKRKISAVIERFRLEVELLRRRLAVTDQPGPQEVASRLRTALRQGTQQPGAKGLDAPGVEGLWEGIYGSLQVILSPRGGILGQVVTFWETTQAFIDGKIQRTLPVGIDGGSKKHHRLSVDGVKDLRNGLIELVNILREGMISFFVDPPPEDLSQLSRRVSAVSVRLSTDTLPHSVFRDARLDLQDDRSFPAAPAASGQLWEKFAFWPPRSNSISGVHHLSKTLALVCTAASEMASLGPVAQADSMVERLRGLVGGARERCVQALCAAWNSDAEHCKLLEDWSRVGEHKDVTQMPAYFTSWESEVMSGLQKILYVSDVVSHVGSTEIVLPPRAKLLQLVRNQFVTSLYKSLSGMVENAERAVESDDDEWGVSSPGRGAAVPGGAASLGSGGRARGSRIDRSSATTDVLDTEDRYVRMLLTFNNLHALRRDAVPHLIGQFENSFSVKLTEESKTIREVLSQIEARLFHTYIRPTMAQLSRIIRGGILSPTWAPPPGGRPNEVRAYVYDALLVVVLVHSQVSATCPSLTPQIMSYLLEQISREFLEVFRQRQPPRYTLAALMQATLDVEFVGQTLAQYTTEKASDMQSQIYMELGKSTSPPSGGGAAGSERGGGEGAKSAEELDMDHSRLQTELPEMRNVLKALREKCRAEFACFKKARSHVQTHVQQQGQLHAVQSP